MSQVKSEDRVPYNVPEHASEILSADETIAAALNILASRLRQPGEAMGSPQQVKNYLTLRLAELEHEVFSVLFLDNRHQVIEYEEMFRGTIDGASVHAREVVKAALKHNAAACILAHNHPSGVPEPSQADQRITVRLREALALVDVRVLDHIIIGGMDNVSFAERGLL